MKGRLEELESRSEGFDNFSESKLGDTESSKIGVTTQHIGFKDFRVVYVYEASVLFSKYLNGNNLDITDFGGIPAKELSEQFKFRLGLKSSLSETLSYGLFRHRYNNTPENNQAIEKTIERMNREFFKKE